MKQTPVCSRYGLQACIRTAGLSRIQSGEKGANRQRDWRVWRRSRSFHGDAQAHLHLSSKYLFSPTRLWPVSGEHMCIISSSEQLPLQALFPGPRLPPPPPPPQELLSRVPSPGWQFQGLLGASCPVDAVTSHVSFMGM